MENIFSWFDANCRFSRSLKEILDEKGSLFIVKQPGKSVLVNGLVADAELSEMFGVKEGDVLFETVNGTEGTKTASWIGENCKFAAERYPYKFSTHPFFVTDPITKQKRQLPDMEHSAGWDRNKPPHEQDWSEENIKRMNPEQRSFDPYDRTPWNRPGAKSYPTPQSQRPAERNKLPNSMTRVPEKQIMIDEDFELAPSIN